MANQGLDVKRHWRGLASVILLFVFSAIVLPARANEAGLLWLLAQQHDDGRIAATPDETTVHHATFEALRTLHLLGYGGDAHLLKALHYLNSDTTVGFPYLPRHLIAKRLAGESAAAQVDELRAYQNANGGFTGWLGEQSSVVDTIEALEALTDAGIDERNIIGPALEFLLALQRADGGFAPSEASPPSVALTARAVSLFQRHLFDYSLGAALQAAAGFLWQHQRADGWGEVWESAQALLALIPVTTDATRYAGAVTALRASQEADGSWVGSVYATALSLRALHLAEHRAAPTDPASGSLMGRAQDGATGLPLAGASIVLLGANLETRTLADGGFELNGVAPGDYSLQYSSTGYGSAQRQLRVEAGRRLDVGTVSLQPLAEIGLLKGVVTDGTSGAPVADALVEVIGVDRTVVATGADGSYELALPPGAVSVTVTANGYEPVTVSGTVVAGATLRFSPALRPAGTKPESTLALRGKVLDGADGTPISGAHITVVGLAETLTGQDGAFRLEGLASAEIALEVLAEGYQGVRLSILATNGGVVDLGELRLARVERPTFSAVRGIVRDAGSGETIAGAVVTIADKSTESDESGRFLIDGIETLSFTLAASAPGYFAQQYTVELTEHGTAELAVTLQRAAFGGIAVVAMTPDRVGYPAYSQVRLNAALENSADSERAVRLHARVLDSQSALVEEFAVAPESVGGSNMLTVAPGTTEEVEVSWYTQHYAPGTYRIWLQVHDAASSELLAERTTHVVVEETRRLEYLRLASDVNQTNQGAAETLQFLLSLRNRSNVPLDPSIVYQWRDPAGAILRADTATVRIEPETISTTVNLARLEHRFDRPGRYPFEIISIEGAEATNMEAGAVVVAPDIRIELQQGVEPGTVLPQGDARLRMRIRIEGVQAP